MSESKIFFHYSHHDWIREWHELKLPSNGSRFVLLILYISLRTRIRPCKSLSSLAHKKSSKRFLYKNELVVEPAGKWIFFITKLHDEASCRNSATLVWQSLFLPLFKCEIKWTTGTVLPWLPYYFSSQRNKSSKPFSNKLIAKNFLLMDIYWNYTLLSLAVRNPGKQEERIFNTTSSSGLP